MKKLKNMFFFALVFPFSMTYAAPPLSETATTENSSFVPVMTRWVKMFLELETELDQVIRQGNRARIDELVKDDFEQRIGAQPGSPVPREDWLVEFSMHAKDMPPLIIEQMAARDLGDIVVVSFKWADRSKAGLLVVDIWKRDGKGWKLAARYVDPAGPASVFVPGSPAAQRVLPKKF